MVKSLTGLSIGFLATVASLSACGETEAPRNMHLFLLGGQSNMSGRGTLSEANRVDHERVFVMTPSGGWRPAVEPFHWEKPKANGAGLAASFARAYADAHPGVTVGLVPIAYGGSPIRSWQPGQVHYTNAVAYARLAMRQGEFKGFLWHQGESDSFTKERVKGYVPLFTNAIVRLRQELGIEDVPFLAGELGPYLKDWQDKKRPNIYWQEMNAEIARGVKLLPRAALVPSAGLLDVKSDRIHFETPSLRQFGLRYYSAYTGLLTRNDWENPEVNSINRLPPRTYAMPLAAEKDALTDALEPETPYAISLNGDWKYSWAGNPDLRVRDFYRTDFDDSDWYEIDVPSCVEMRGFGSPGYTNQRYPHANLSHPTNAAFASIRDRQSGRADYNPVSSYRTRFTVPDAWKDRRVILRFDGVYSAYYVWVNGKRVGYAEDSKLPSEFDITDVIGKREEGRGKRENVLAVEVYRWCDGSYLEDQDMTRFSGIFRDVTLWSMPKDGIWDFAVRTTPVGGYERWRIEVEVDDGLDAISLYDADGKKTGDLTPLSTSTYSLDLAPRMWSAEKPYLYTLVLRKGSDIRMKRVGFKEQKIVGHTFLVNGQPVKFKGVNRHETNPDNGRTVSLDDMLRDITLMKRYNVNTVRTSHYPDHHLWYDLCDRYGIYLCAEANVEGHEPQYGENGLGRFKEWEHSIVERNERQVLTLRNHPSVTLWSMGNETGHGDCFRRAIAAVKKIDSSRPIHWERGNPDADVDSRMYPSVEWLEERGKMGDDSSLSAVRGDKYDRPENAQTPGKCFFLCEYAHAMGNAIGNFEEYWDVFYRHESLSGGCIWDWVDQAGWKYTDRAVDGKRERFLCYGGDSDEQPNDGPFNCNGVIDPERNVTAKLIEVGHVFRNLVVTKRDDGSLELWNRNCFTWADEFDGAWELVADGVVVERGTFAVPHLAPLSRAPLDIPLPPIAKDLKERFLNVSFLSREDSPWAKKGWSVARDQVPLGGKWESGVLATSQSGQESASPILREDEKTVVVRNGGTRAVFCRRSGTLCELEMNGVRILKDPAPGVTAGPRLTCARAFVDNDRWVRGNPSTPEKMDVGVFLSSGLTQLRYHVRPIRVADGKVRVTTEVTGSKSAGFTHVAEWTVADDGSVLVRNEVTPHGTMPVALPRLGLSLMLDESLERMRYYGRGPRENYIDRCTASFVGLYESTVTDQYESYVRPQDNGYKTDVRWVAFADESGRGVRFSASEPLFVQALHYSCEDLDLARPQRGQPRFRTPLVPRREVCLNLDVRQLGLGGGSCGPRPMDKYIFPIEKTSWTLRIEPVQR